MKHSKFITVCFILMLITWEVWDQSVVILDKYKKFKDIHSLLLFISLVITYIFYLHAPIHCVFLNICIYYSVPLWFWHFTVLWFYDICFFFWNSCYESLISFKLMIINIKFLEFSIISQIIWDFWNMLPIL